MNGKRRHRLRTVLRGGVAFIALAISGAAFAASAAADATDDYPIPHRWVSRRAEQILAAAKDFAPIYYQRYIIDKHNEPPEVQQAAIDNAHYFDALSRNAMMTTTPQLSTDLTQRTRDLSAAPKMKTLIHLMKTATFSVDNRDYPSTDS
jgi:Domain of unknown function (DUF5078)